MIKFISNLFKKEKIVRDETVGISNLLNWYEEVTAKCAEDFRGKTKEQYKNIKENMNKIQERLIELEKAQLRNPNISTKEMQLMEGNKENYIASVNRFLISIELPKEITTKNISSFISNYEDLLDAFTKSTRRNYYILQEFFSKESGKVSESIKEMDSLIRDLIDQKMESVERIREDINNLDKKIYKKRLAQETYASEKQKLEEFEQLRSRAKNRIEEIRSSSQFKELNNLEEEKASYTKDLSNTEDDIINLFSPLQRAMRKFVRISITDEILLEKYLNSAKTALMEDADLKIIALIDSMKRSIQSGTLDLKEDEKEKTIRSIENVTYDMLKRYKERYDDIRQQIESCKKRIALNNVTHQLKEEEYKFNHNQDKIRIIKSNIEKLDAILNGDDIIKLTKYIKDRIKDVLSICLDLTGEELEKRAD